MRKICVLTGTRAEYGLLRGLLHAIQANKDAELQLLVTNMHLDSRFGNTYQEIENDGFNIDRKIYCLDENEPITARSTINAMSKVMNGVACALLELSPDIIVLLGDRYEVMAAATAAMILRIPIAHIHGGELTEGAYDDSIRHAVTKMSNLHFTSTEIYRKRVIQMGEDPGSVFNVGSLGVENIFKLKLFSRSQIETILNFKIDDKTILVTLHPTTRGASSTESLIENFLSVLEERQDLRIIFTMPNSDEGRDIIAKKIMEFVRHNDLRSIVFASLGVVRYLSVMRCVSAVVGNSSSGILEAPSFGIPTLDIGDRQTGRVTAKSVYHCDSDYNSIQKGLSNVLSEPFKSAACDVQNPYYKPNVAKSIMNELMTVDLNKLIKKHFFDL